MNCPTFHVLPIVGCRFLRSSVFCLPSPVSGLLSPVSILLSPVSGLPSSVSHLLSPVSGLRSSVFLRSALNPFVFWILEFGIWTLFCNQCFAAPAVHQNRDRFREPCMPDKPGMFNNRHFFQHLKIDKCLIRIIGNRKISNIH
jgi:hypothetical protein